MADIFLRVPKFLRRSPPLYAHAFFWWMVVAGFVMSIESCLAFRVAAFFGGALGQSFFEYASHRWAFHGFLWQMHRGHHVKPGDISRLLVPFAYSVPCAVFEFTLFCVVVGVHITCALAAGAACWYIFFEWVHYTCHQPELAWFCKIFPFYQHLKYAHKVHHVEPSPTFDDPLTYTYYGFTTTLWDRIFDTMPAEKVKL